MVIRAGTLNERIAIESPVRTQNSVGEETTTWATFATVWADVQQASGTERFMSGADVIQATGVYDITVRYRIDLTTQMRIQWRGRTMNILSIDPRRADGELRILCQAVE